MSVEVSAFDSDAWGDTPADWLIETGLWDGRPVSWEKLPAFHQEVERKIVQLIEAQGPQSDSLLAYLAWIGASESKRPQLKRDIALMSKEIFVLVKHKHKKKNEESFYKNHKTAIWIGVALVAFAVAATVVIVLSTGAAGSIVGGAAAGALPSEDDEKTSKNRLGPQATPQTPSIALAEKGLAIARPDVASPQLPAPPLLDTSPLPISAIQPPSVQTPRASLAPFEYLKDGVRLGDRYIRYADALKELQGDLGWRLELERNPLAAPPSISEESKPLHAAPRDLLAQPSPSNTAFPQEAPKPSPVRDFFIQLLDPEFRSLETPLIDEPEFSRRLKTGGAEHSKYRIGWINGMNNSVEEATKSANYLSNLAGGLNIDWVYNHSHGAVIDAAEIFTVNYPGYSPNTAKLLQESWTEFHNQHKDNPSLKILQFCHSQGAIHVKNALKQAPPEICHRVIVVAIAPGDIIPKKLCYDSFNYASERDFVPYGKIFYNQVVKGGVGGIVGGVLSELSGENEKEREEFEELIWLEPHPEAPLHDHAWDSPTFKEKIKEVLIEYTNRNGNYENNK